MKESLDIVIENEFDAKELVMSLLDKYLLGEIDSIFYNGKILNTINKVNQLSQNDSLVYTTTGKGYLIVSPCPSNSYRLVSVCTTNHIDGNFLIEKNGVLSIFHYDTKFVDAQTNVDLDSHYSLGFDKILSEISIEKDKYNEEIINTKQNYSKRFQSKDMYFVASFEIWVSKQNTVLFESLSNFDDSTKLYFYQKNDDWLYLKLFKSINDSRSKNIEVVQKTVLEYLKLIESTD